MSWNRLRESLALKIKQIQTCPDKQIPALPPSSRLFLAPVLSALAALNAARDPARQFLYRSGLFSTFALPAPVISIGHLTGASGKTPFVEYLARHFWQHHGLASLVIQLGGGTMDEVVMLRHVFDDTPIHVTDEDSTQRAREILHENPSLRLVLLDNGLQHLPLMRDFDILAINALSPFGNGHLHPRGTLREPYRPALKRTDSIVLHHVDLAGPDGVAAATRTLGPLLPKHALMTHTQMAPVSLRSLVPPQRSLDMSEFQGLGEDLGLGRLHGAAVVCLTGVGSPFTVEAHLRQLGATYVEGCGAHEDHHLFSVEEVDAAVARVRQLARDPAFSHACILLTEKDYYRQMELWSSVLSRYSAELCTTEAPGGAALAAGEKAADAVPMWGAYVLHSELQIVEHDKRFSSQKATLGAMLRLSIDNFRRRNYIT